MNFLIYLRLTKRSESIVERYNNYIFFKKKVRAIIRCIWISSPIRSSVNPNHNGFRNRFIELCLWNIIQLFQSFCKILHVLVKRKQINLLTCGVNTLRYKQSSEPTTVESLLLNWMHTLPSEVALNTFPHASFSTGGYTNIQYVLTYRFNYKI